MRHFEDMVWMSETDAAETEAVEETEAAEALYIDSMEAATWP